MVSLAAIIVVATSLCCVFTTTNGLSCYKCAWTDKLCATEQSDANLKSITCAAGGGGDATTDATSSAPDASTPAPAKLLMTNDGGLDKHRKPFHGMADAAFFCFKVDVKSNGTTAVERGCKSTKNVDDCLPKAEGITVENCAVCETDNCNGNSGQSRVTGYAVQCALVSSLVIARMFFQTKSSSIII